MNPNYFILTIFIIVGCLVILAAAFNWEWFFTARNARFITGRFGRKWARILYAIIGIIVIVQASLMFHSILNSNT